MSGIEAGWHPDPTGRHQQRWWDGTTWTDQVADRGAVSTDPVAGQQSPTEQHAQAATIGQPDHFGTAPAPYPESDPVSGSRSNKLPLLIGGGVVVVLLIVAGAFLLLGGDDSDGTGKFAGAIESSDGSFAREIELETGDALGVSLENQTKDFDAILLLSAADDESADAIVDFEADQLEIEDGKAGHDELADDVEAYTGATPDGMLFLVRDDSAEGEDEGYGLTLPVSGTFAITVVGAEDSEGEFVLTVAKQSTDEDLGNSPGYEEIDDLTTGEHKKFLAEYTDDPVIFEDSFAIDTDPVEPSGPDTPSDPGSDPFDPAMPGSLDEAEVAEFLADELAVSAGLSDTDSMCVAEVIIDEIGVEGLIDLGLSTGGSGDIEDLDEQSFMELQNLIVDAFVACDVDPTQGPN